MCRLAFAGSCKVYDASANLSTSIMVNDTAISAITTGGGGKGTGGLSGQLAECLVLLSQLDRDSSDDAGASVKEAVTIHCLQSMMLLHGGV